jgi:hypothetical protein
MTEEFLPQTLPAPGTQANIPGWIEVTGYRQTTTSTGSPTTILLVINKDSIVSVRKTSDATCHIHVLSNVDYHISMTYEQVKALL